MSTTEQQPNQNTNDIQAGQVQHPMRVFWTAIFAFLIPIGALILILEYATNDLRTGGSPRALTHEAVIERIQPVARIAFEAPADDGVTDLKTGEEVYNSTCATCHADGVAGAPKFGDQAAWAPFIETGYENLLEVALHGRGAMPAKGGNTSLDDLEVERAMVYMANAAGADYAEPSADGDAQAAADTGEAADSTEVAAADTDAATKAADDKATDTDDTQAAAQGDDKADSDDATDGTKVAAADTDDSDTAAADEAADSDAAADTTEVAAAGAAGDDEFAATDEQLEIGKKLYESNCFACHATGVANAPLFGSAEAWQPYVDTGLDAMLQVAIDGTGAMPPRGASTATDDELKAAILYMLSENK